MEIQPAPAPAVDPRPGAELDVVVVGGGGHVGLPLSLVLADAGLRVGIFDIAEDTLATIAAGRVPFLESGADALLERVLASGRLELSTKPGMIGRAQTVLGRHRHPDRRVPQSVDGDLRPGGPADGPAPPGWGARDPSKHRLPGDHGLRHAGAPGAGLPRGRRVLPGADRGGPRARRAALAAPDRGGRRSAGRRPGGSALRAADGPRHPHQLARGGARQALHQHLALHEVRDREPVPDGGPRGRDRLHERPRRRSPGLPARRRPSGPRVRRRPLPLQGHDAAGRVHQRSLPHGPGRDAGERGAAGVHGSRARASPGVAAGAHHRHPGDGLQGGVRRQPGIPQLQAAQAADLGRRPRAVRRSVRPGRAPRAARHAPGGGRDHRAGGPAPRLPGAGPRRPGGRRRLGRPGPRDHL